MSAQRVRRDAAADELREAAQRIRRQVVSMCAARGQGYAGQGLALADVMAHLFFRAMRRDRDGALVDRFVLSTGHSAIALFAALGELGVYTAEELSTYGTAGSRIEESPLSDTPGFEVTGGSLGQGLSQAIGMAVGARISQRDLTVYCLISDGELQEGQTWEAAMFAAHHRLGNLVTLVDNNRMQADGDTGAVMEVEPVAAKFAAFGWTVREIDANDHGALWDALPAGGANVAAPHVIVCKTLPGKGVPSFEQYQKVHYIRASSGTWRQALTELS